MHQLDRLADRCVGGAVEGVEQLAEGYGGWAPLAGVLVGPGVGDHQRLGRGQDRVAQQLPVLAADVALAGDRAAGEHVVAVGQPEPGEHPVVEAEQADHPVRDGAHRHHRADREGAGAEVGAGRPPGEVRGEQRPDVGQPQCGVGEGVGVGGHPGQLALDLADLPAVVAADLGEHVDAVAQRAQPVGERPGAVQAVGHRPHPVDVLREPAGQLDAGAADVVERQRGVEPGLGVGGHHHAGEHPVEPGAPGVLLVAGQPERVAVLAVEGPADAGLADPGGDRVEVVVGEPEAAADRLGLGEVEDLAGGGPAAGDVEELRGDTEQGVRLRERPVGEPDPQLVGRVAALDQVTEAEAGGDQRGVRLDVGAHHQDVARLEGRVGLEHPEQHLAEDVDLAGGAVAGVHLDAAVVGGSLPSGRSEGVAAQVVLQPAEQGVRGRGHRGVVVVGRNRGQGPLQLAAVAGEGGQQRVSGLVVAVVGGAVDGTSAEGRGERVPERAAGVRQPEVYGAARGQRGEQLDLGDRQPGVAEQGQPVGQVERRRLVTEPGQGVRVPLVRRRGADPVDEPPPQLGLPGQVVVEVAAAAVGGPALEPVGQQRRPLDGVRREQAGQPRGDGVPPTLPQLGLGAGVEVAEVPGHRRAPRLVEGVVEHRQQRPGHRVGGPRVVVGEPEHRGHQRPRRGEPHARTDPVTRAGRRPEPVRQPLGEPALDPLRGHHHDLLGERVRQGGREQPGQPVGEHVGALGAVQVQAHGGSVSRATDGRGHCRIRRTPRTARPILCR